MNPLTTAWEDSVDIGGRLACVYTLSNDEAGTYYTYAIDDNDNNLLAQDYIEAITEEDAKRNHLQTIDDIRT